MIQTFNLVNVPIAFEPTIKRNRKGQDYVKFSVSLPVKKAGSLKNKYVYIECVATESLICDKIMASGVKKGDLVALIGRWHFDGYGGNVSMKCYVLEYEIITKKEIACTPKQEPTSDLEIETENQDVVVKIDRESVEEIEDDFWG